MKKSARKTSESAPRPTQAERAALAEEKMVNATIELLNTSGLAGATLSAIGERAGYSRGLASHHFGTKSGLFRKVLKHITSVWTEELSRGIEGKSGLTAILASLDTYRDHFRQMPHHARALYMLWSGAFDPASEFKPNVRSFYRLQRHGAASWVLEGQRTGEIGMHVDPQKFAEQFYASLLGINYQWLVDPDMDMPAAMDYLKKNIVILLQAR